MPNGEKPYVQLAIFLRKAHIHIIVSYCVVVPSVLHFSAFIPVSFLPPDTSLAPHLLLPALSTVRDFWGELGLLGVPYSVRDRIRQDPSYSSEDERRMAGLQYCLQTLPGVSWGRIAGVLWYSEHHTALETVRPYLPHKPGDYTQYVPMLHCSRNVTIML